MSRTLLRVLATTLVVIMALVQTQTTEAYHGMGLASQPPVEVEVMVAYVDPGAAGFIIVSVLGFISAIGYTARTYLGKLKRIVLRGGRKARQDESGVADTDG